MVLSCNKKLSALLRGITSKHNDDGCCINYLHSSRTNNELEKKKHTHTHMKTGIKIMTIVM